MLKPENPEIHPWSSWGFHVYSQSSCYIYSFQSLLPTPSLTLDHEISYQDSFPLWTYSSFHIVLNVFTSLVHSFAVLRNLYFLQPTCNIKFFNQLIKQVFTEYLSHFPPHISFDSTMTAPLLPRDSYSSLTTSPISASLLFPNPNPITIITGIRSFPCPKAHSGLPLYSYWILEP